jgi:hypothetical protein
MQKHTNLQPVRQMHTKVQPFSSKDLGKFGCTQPHRVGYLIHSTGISILALKEIQTRALEEFLLQISHLLGNGNIPVPFSQRRNCEPKEFSS